MQEIEKRTKAILDSPLGCAFMMGVYESAIEPEALAAPELSLRLAAESIGLVEHFRSDHEIAVAEALEYGKGLGPLTRAVLEHHGTSWWFEPIDLGRQLWIGKGIASPDTASPDTASWHPPPDPPSRWEVYAQQPAGVQNTSTLFGEHCSLLMAYDVRAGDYWREYPLACWKLQIAPDVKVYEVLGAEDWHQLCVQYPARRRDGGLTVNWGAAARDWDGVHLSLGGLLSGEQAGYESAVGWSLLDFWHAEQTFWFRSLESVSERLPDHERTESTIQFRYPITLGDTRGQTFLTTDPVGLADIEQLKRSIRPPDSL